MTFHQCFYCSKKFLFNSKKKGRNLKLNKNLISLNHASKEQLMTIKGIGPKTADKIIDYRNEHPFATIEEIKEVSGIGEKTYLRIRELLCL